jgi:autotransporter-associated beta strand protein
MEPRALLSAVSWTGGAGDNNWDTAANWNTDAVPGSADDVTIDVVADVVHSNNIVDSINSLTSTQPLTISGGSLSIAAASTISSTLSISGGTLEGSGDVSVNGVVTLITGKLSGSGALDANGGMLINSAGGVFDLDGRSVNNAAGQTATWTGDLSGIEASNGSVFNNLGTFMADSSEVYAESGIGAPSAFNDLGTFITAQDGASPGFGVAFNVPGGSVKTVAQSRLDLDNGGTSTGGGFNIDGLLGFGNPYDFDLTTTISGTGELQKSGIGTLVLPGNYTFAGSIDVVHGTVQADGSLADSTVSFSDSDDGTVSGTGTVGATQVGGLTLSPGDSPNPGILNAQGDVSFAAHTDDVDEVGSTFAIALNGAPAGTGYSQLNASGQVDLGGCDFTAALGFTPANGEQFTIVKSTAGIIGTFFQLPEGASLTIGDQPFTITYAGGGGHDVVLTQSVTPAPTVTGVSPNIGPAAGGTLVTITGTGFKGASAVEFGATAATGVSVMNDSTITALSPAGSGAVDVTLITPGGTSETSSADRFTYTAAPAAPAAPAVTGISPNTGPAAGGTLVTISGSGFSGATTVEFGTTAATGLKVLSDSTITADSPADTGTLDVTVITSAGTSAATPADRFTYTVTTPTVVSVKRFGFHMQPTMLVLTFSSALDAARAEDMNNYKIVTLGGRGRNSGAVGHLTRVRAARYDPSTLTVTLYPRQRLDFHNVYRLKVDGMKPNGLKSAAGLPLDSRGNTVQGRDYVTTLTSKNLVFTPAEARRYQMTARAAHVPRSSSSSSFR